MINQRNNKNFREIKNNFIVYYVIGKDKILDKSMGKESVVHYQNFLLEIPKKIMEEKQIFSFLITFNSFQDSETNGKGKYKAIKYSMEHILFNNGPKFIKFPLSIKLDTSKKRNCGGKKEREREKEFLKGSTIGTDNRNGTMVNGINHFLDSTSWNTKDSYNQQSFLRKINSAMCNHTNSHESTLH